MYLATRKRLILGMLKTLRASLGPQVVPSFLAKKMSLVAEVVDRARRRTPFGCDRLVMDAPEWGPRPLCSLPKLEQLGLAFQTQF